MSWRVTTASPDETRALGRALGRACGGPAVVALEGDLGAGKTCFAQGAAEGLGVGETVVSPTFVLLAEYEGRLPLLHADAYRLLEGEAEGIGLGEQVERWGGLVLVEWADRVEDSLPAGRLAVRFRIGAGDARDLEIDARGEPHGLLLDAWRRAWEER